MNLNVVLSQCTDLGGVSLRITPVPLIEPLVVEFFNASTSCAGSVLVSRTDVTFGQCVNLFVGSLQLSPTASLNITTIAIFAPSITCAGASGTADITLSTCIALGGGTCSLRVSQFVPTTRTTSTSTTTTTPPPPPAPPSNTCFHRDTVITYKDRQYSLADFKNHPECHIPHVVSAPGIRIETSDGFVLRLTNDHLVFTTKGLARAAALGEGEILFTSISDETKITRIKHISTESDESYFGLNCLHSEVLANGIKASTFGRFHHVPAFWMKNSGFLLGIKRASDFGDSLVTLLSKVGIL